MTSLWNSIAHAGEALWVNASDRATHTLAEEALHLLSSSLVRLVADEDNARAREDALEGAFLAGAAFGDAGSGLHHKLCHVLGGAFGLPHAATHAVVFPHVVRFHREAAPQAMNAIARALGVIDPVLGLEHLARVTGAASPVDAPDETKTITVEYAFDRDMMNKGFDKTFTDGFEKKGIKIDETLTAHAHFDVKDAKITGTVTYVKKSTGHYSILEADLVASGHYDADMQVDRDVHVKGDAKNAKVGDWDKMLMAGKPVPLVKSVMPANIPIAGPLFLRAHFDLSAACDMEIEGSMHATTGVGIAGDVAEHIGEVLMPSFSLMEDAQRRSAVVRAAALMALVVSPLGVGLGAVAPTVVSAFFDDRWAPMAPLLAILSVMTVFRPMTWSASAYLQAIQKTRLIMSMSFARAALVLTLVATLGAAGPLCQRSCRLRRVAA